MSRDRSTMPEPRLEMMPLIDVVFLLLTFFVFAMVLSARLEVTNIELPQATAGTSPDVAQYVILALREDGTLTLDGEAIEWENAMGALAQAKIDESTRLLVAPDVRGMSGDLFRLLDMLQDAQIEQVQFLRAPDSDEGVSGPTPDGT